MNKLVNCKACNAEISKSAKTCPTCGHKNKKPIYKQWWLYVIVVIFIIVILSNLPSDSNTASNDSTEKNTVTSKESQSTNSVNLDLPFNIYKAMGDNDAVPYSITAKAETFLKEYTDLFPAKSVDSISAHIDYELEARYVNKSPDDYGDKLMYFPYLYVNQIYQTEIDSTHYITELNVADQDINQYYVFYLGKLENVFENDVIELYGLPLNTSSFENTDGGKTLVIVFAGSVIEKIIE